MPAPGFTGQRALRENWLRSGTRCCGERQPPLWVRESRWPQRGLSARWKSAERLPGRRPDSDEPETRGHSVLACAPTGQPGTPGTPGTGTPGTGSRLSAARSGRAVVAGQGRLGSRAVQPGPALPPSIRRAAHPKLSGIHVWGTVLSAALTGGGSLFSAHWERNKILLKRR